jgi:hypothetical protein
MSAFDPLRTFACHDAARPIGLEAAAAQARRDPSWLVPRTASALGA